MSWENLHTDIDSAHNRSDSDDNAPEVSFYDFEDPTDPDDPNARHLFTPNLFKSTDSDAPYVNAPPDQEDENSGSSSQQYHRVRL